MLFFCGSAFAAAAFAPGFGFGFGFSATRSKIRRASRLSVWGAGGFVLVWVLARGYEIAPSEIGAAIRHLINATNVVVNRPAVEAGLAQLDAGDDFAAGVIAFEGRWLGAEVFVSFDREAAKLMEARGEAVRLLP